MLKNRLSKEFSKFTYRPNRLIFAKIEKNEQNNLPQSSEIAISKEEKKQFTEPLSTTTRLQVFVSILEKEIFEYHSDMIVIREIVRIIEIESKSDADKIQTLAANLAQNRNNILRIIHKHIT